MRKGLVKIHLYAGRRNPEWLLTEKDTDEFFYLWNKAAESEQPFKIVSKLGYAGCMLIVADAQYYIYNGKAALMKNNTSLVVKEDITGAMETLLLKHAPDEVKQQLEK